MEYIYGNLFGISQVIIGYPFDTLKTNIQNSNSIKPYFTNPIKLYSGIKYPLYTNCICTGLLFGNYDYFYNLTNHRLFSGALTGAISACILTPFDYKKIQAQYYSCDNTKNIKNIKNIKTTLILENETYWHAFKRYYAGFRYTVSREIISIPVYFTTFHYLNEKLNSNEYSNKWYANSFISGGIAGMSSWLSTYPIDTLKSRKQLYPSYNLKQLYKMGPLFNGLGITLLRAFIVNGTSFYMYSKITKS